jgi:hypothetical protein
LSPHWIRGTPTHPTRVHSEVAVYGYRNPLLLGVEVVVGMKHFFIVGVTRQSRAAKVWKASL